MMQNLYVDAHLHLQDARFSGITNDLVMHAESAGIRCLFCNAVTESDWAVVTALSRTYPGVVPFVGIHPWFCTEAEQGWRTRLADLLGAMTDQICGIGETGLDTVKPVDFTTQKQCFIEHLELAADVNLPVSIHCVKAWGPLLDILKAFSTGRNLPTMMIHSFNGSTETMKRLVDYGCFISYACTIAHAGRHRLRDTVKRTPVSALMLETDSPYQKCSDLNGVRYITAEHNEPVAVSALYRYTAKLLDMNVSELSSHLWENAAIFTNQTVDR